MAYTEPIETTDLFQWERRDGAAYLTKQVFATGTVNYDLRLWYTNDEGELRPTGKGIVIPADQAAGLARALLSADHDVAPSARNGAVKKAAPKRVKKAVAK